jgi:hypothetical protein
VVVRVREWRRTTRRKGLVVRVSADMVDREEAILIRMYTCGLIACVTTSSLLGGLRDVEV